jgi:putative DNA primase/helicase
MSETAKDAAKRLAAPILSKGFKPQALHTYRDPHGVPLYWRIRAKHPETGEKWIRPMHLNGRGFQLGEPKWDGPKPIYNLDRIAKAAPDAPVFIVEGEWAADHLTRLGILNTTSGGADSADRADWTPLKGRACITWRDLDEPGRMYAEEVSAKLRALECPVSHLDVEALGLTPKSDAVDWIAANPKATAIQVLSLPRVEALQATRDAPPPSSPTATTKSAPAPSVASPRAILRCFADMESKPVRWLWYGKIARGKVSMLAGNPGLGKSQVTASMAAVITTGGAWPVDRSRCQVGNVVFLSAEDDAEDTIRPRLEAAGADLSRCAILDAVVDGYTANGGELRRHFDLGRDIDRLAEAIEKLGNVALVVIDPISAYLGDANSHNNAEVRALLAPLGDLAARHGSAIVGVSHLNKGGSNEALLRVTGSLAFVAAARAAFVITSDKEDPRRRLFLPLKNNIGSDTSGLAFAIEPVTVPSSAGPIDVSRVSWESEGVAITADEAMAPAMDSEERTDLDDARSFLLALLQDGPVPSTQVRRDSDGAGHSWATIRRAQRALGIEATKEGMKGPWQWRLPPKMLKNAEDAQPQSVSTFGDIEQLRADPVAAAGSDDPALMALIERVAAHWKCGPEDLAAMKATARTSPGEAWRTFTAAAESEGIA